MLDGKKDIQPVKSDWSISHSELKLYVLPSLEGNDKGCKANSNTQRRQSGFIAL